MYLLNMFLILSVLLICPSDIFAKMYKWVDENGQIHWSDTPPPPDEEALNLKEYETVEDKAKSRGLYKKPPQKSRYRRSNKPQPAYLESPKTSLKQYIGTGGGHWIQNNIDNGTYIMLEDGSLWEIDPIDKIDAMLWLPISNIIVIQSNKGSPGYDYLLINTDDGEKVYAKYMGSR